MCTYLVQYSKYMERLVVVVGAAISWCSKCRIQIQPTNGFPRRELYKLWVKDIAQDAGNWRLSATLYCCLRWGSRLQLDKDTENNAGNARLPATC